MDATGIAVTLIFVCTIASVLFLALRRRQVSVRCCGRHAVIIDQSWPPLAGALLMVAVGGLSMKEAVMSGIVGEGRLRPYEVLCVFFSLVYISSVLDLTGGLEYIALLAASRAKSGRSLFLLVYSLASVLTLVTSNDVVILLLTPLVIRLCGAVRIDPKPYLFALFYAANIASMALLFGNPTNLIIGQATGIDPVLYVQWMALPSLVAVLVCLATLLVYFRRSLPNNIELFQVDANTALLDKRGAIFTTAVLALTLLLLTLSPYLGLPLSLVSLFSALMTFGYCCVSYPFIKRDNVEGEYQGRDRGGGGGLAGEKGTEGPRGRQKEAATVELTIAPLGSLTEEVKEDEEEQAKPRHGGGGQEAEPKSNGTVTIAANPAAATDVPQPYNKDASQFTKDIRRQQHLFPQENQQQKQKRQQQQKWKQQQQKELHLPRPQETLNIDSELPNLPPPDDAKAIPISDVIPNGHHQKQQQKQQQAEQQKEEEEQQPQLPITVCAGIRKVPWKLAPFLIGMFIMVEALSRATGLAEGLGRFFVGVSHNGFVSTACGLVAAVVTSNVVNNQPASIFLTNAFVSEAFSQADLPQSEGLRIIFAAIAGTNLAANFTLIGALAGVMFSRMCAERERSIGALEFSWVGLIIMPCTAAATILVLWAESLYC